MKLKPGDSCLYVGTSPFTAPFRYSPCTIVSRDEILSAFFVDFGSQRRYVFSDDLIRISLRKPDVGDLVIVGKIGRDSVDQRNEREGGHLGERGVIASHEDGNSYHIVFGSGKVLWDDEGDLFVLLQDKEDQKTSSMSDLHPGIADDLCALCTRPFFDSSIFFDGTTSYQASPQGEVRVITNSPQKGFIETCMETLREIPNKIKRFLNAQYKAFYQLGWVDEDLDLTEEGQSELLAFLLDKFEKDFGEVARERIEEIEKEQKKKKTE